MTGSRLPPLNAVRAFEAAARLGSFTCAAQELGTTQAAVSYQIKVLEERVGEPLFLRRPRQVVLTEVGRTLAPAVSAAFETLAGAFAALRDDADGLLTISAVHTLASNWLVPRLGAFQLAHPAIAVRLDTSSRMVDFAREEVDVGLRIGAGEWPGLQAHLLLRSRFTPLCSPSLIERLGDATPGDLTRMPLLDTGDPWWPAWFKLAGVPAPEPKTRGGLSLDHQQIVGMAAMAGQGVAIMNPALFAEDLRAGRLVQPFDLVGTDPMSYWLVYPAARRNIGKIRAFRDWLLAQAPGDA